MKKEDVKPGVTLRRKALMGEEVDSYDELLVLAVADFEEIPGVQYAWCRYVLSDLSWPEFASVSTDKLATNWEIHLPFFKVGEFYEERLTGTTYKILELVRLDNPYNDEPDVAVAIITWKDGLQAVMPVNAKDRARLALVD